MLSKAENAYFCSIKHTNMEYQDILPLVNQFNNKMAMVDLTFKRYLHQKINWEARLIGIKGARGVGKSTLLLQHIKESFPNMQKVFYASLDDLWFRAHDLMELVEYLYTHGFTHLFLDEVHKLSDWSRYIKNIYDSYPQLHIVYTGSSMLEIDHSKVDLSRRQMLYTFRGLSFREYLDFEGIGAFPVINVEELFGSHLSIAMEIVSHTRVLQHFDRYLQMGYYPFYKESTSMDDYHSRLREVANVVVESDMPAVEEITYATVQKAKQLLMVIAPNVPLQPNISRLSQELEVTPSQCLKILYLLDRAGLLLLLTKEQKDYKHLAKPGKIFLGDGNLMYALSSIVNLGTCRETFFANQLSAIGQLTMPEKGDFLLDGKYLFEVGGSSKNFRQIANIPNSYLAIDDVEIGHLNRIPLWMFGLLY
jgi:hypothetical protein